MDVAQVLADLLAEQEALDVIVAPLAPDEWALATPSPGWTVADQIGHLTYFDGTATQAILDPVGFTAGVTGLLASLGGDTDPTLETSRAMQPDELLATWRSNRAALAAAAADLDEHARVVWYGPSMSAKSFLTARLMEVWAHGQDIVDALDADRAPTDRLRHVAQLGFITRGWSYANRGLTAPDTPVRVVLVAPSGATWDFGEPDAPESVTGPAVEFCLVVTQRRHVDDTALVIDGDAARDWMLRAQAFAGAATDGPVSGRTD